MIPCKRCQGNKEAFVPQAALVEGQQQLLMQDECRRQSQVRPPPEVQQDLTQLKAELAHIKARFADTQACAYYHVYLPLVLVHGSFSECLH